MTMICVACSKCEQYHKWEGGNDQEVLNLNENALKSSKAEKKKITIIPGASHLFEEPGKLEQVARITSGWFRCYFLIQKYGV